MLIILELFLEFFKIGLFTFGGGFAMIPLVKETVVNKGWLSIDEFTNFIGVCESTPGPIAVNMATYIGSTQAGILGSVFATLGVVLPSFLIILLIASILNNFTKNKYFQSFIKGVKPVIVALISSTGIILLAKAIGYQTLESINLNIESICCFCVILIVYNIVTLVFKKKMSSILVILLSAVLGIGFSVLFEYLPL